MGGPGSGTYTTISKAWDLADHADLLLRQAERALYDPSSSLTQEWVDSQRAELSKLQDQLKSAILRERKSDGKT